MTQFGFVEFHRLVRFCKLWAMSSMAGGWSFCGSVGSAAILGRPLPCPVSRAISRCVMVCDKLYLKLCSDEWFTLRGAQRAELTTGQSICSNMHSGQ